MNETQIRTKYIHVNSRHRQMSRYQDKAEMKIHLQQPIKNAYRVAVKSFTLANSFHNVRTGENTLSWVEFFKATGTSTFEHKKFTITIPPAYYSAAELCAKVNELINTDTTFSATHKVLTESPLFVKFEQDTDKYNVTLKLVQASGEKWFSPLHDTEQGRTLWDSLGFSRHQLIPSPDNTQDETISFIKGQLPSAGSNTALYNTATGDMLAVKGSTSETEIVLTSSLPAHIENAGGVYITSDSLTTGSTYESRKNEQQGLTEALPVNILEWVQFEVDRYSWVQYKAGILHYHHLNAMDITDFDIQLRSVNGVTLSMKECGEFNLVLQIETIEEHMKSPQFHEQYNKEGYRIAHKPDRI